MDKKANTVKWYNSIVFQVIAVNVVLFIVFNGIMFVTMNSLDTSVDTSTSLIDYIASVTMHESNVSSDVYYLY